MKGKLTDTNARISDGGRAERYWRGRTVKGKNSLPEQKNDTPDLHGTLREYGLKGFEFGNWLNNNDRYDHVLACQKALQNLSWIMRTKNLGMNRLVGIAFGARGQTAALAHFEPSANMINLT